MKWFSFPLPLMFFVAVAAGQTTPSASAVREAAERSDFLSAANLSASLADEYRKSGEVKQALSYDSLTLRYARLGNDSLLVLKTLNTYSFGLMDAGRLAKADELLSEAETLKRLSRAEELRWYSAKGVYHFKRSHMDDAAAVYGKGMNKAQEYGNELEAMNFKSSLGETWLYKGTADSMHLVYEALEYFEKKSLWPAAFNAAFTAATGFQLHFNPDKSLVYFQKALDFAKRSGSKARMMKARAGIGQTYLSQRKYTEAEAELLQASKFYQDKSNLPQLAVANIYLGQLYIETDKLEAAEKSLAVAEEANAIVKLEPLQAGINTIRSLLMAKRKDFKAADSLATLGGKMLLRNVDKGVVKMAQKKMTEGDSELAKNPAGLSSFLDGVKNGTIRSLGMDSNDYKHLLNLNIYTGHPSNDDSAILSSLNRQLLDADAKYKTRIFADSLKLQKQESEIARQESEISKKETTLVKQESRAKTLIIAAGALLLVLVAGSLMLQIKNRRRAERDKARIELLQNEIHHRVKNNLAVINRLVDVAGKDSVYDAPLAALKTRIKSIELLHRHLYSEEAKTGNIALQPYFDDLCTAIAATFETAKDIRIRVAADAEVDSTVAEKLGLIVNELVTNSFKYAFDGKKEGSIDVKASQLNNALNVTVQDNGIGLPEEKAKGSYGMKLIKGLSHELNGKFSFQNDHGTAFQLSIPA